MFPALFRRDATRIARQFESEFCRPHSPARPAEMILGGYAKFMKYAMSLILVLIALRLGVKLPWKETFLKLIDLFVK